MDNQSLIWTEKYRPKILNEYFISKNQLDKVKEWIIDLRTNAEEAKPFLILHGTAGIGKTTLAHLIFQKYGYEIIECNASDTRSKKQIRDLIGGISSISVCVDNKDKFKKTAIIMDEIDGLNSINEASGIQELIDIIITRDKKSKDIKWICPVICTTNNIKEKKMQPLLKLGVLLKLLKPTVNDSVKLINKIAKTEGFEIDIQSKTNIINKANGDYRQIILLLYEYYNLKNIYKNNNNNNSDNNNNNNNNNNSDNNDNNNNSDNKDYNNNSNNKDNNNNSNNKNINESTNKIKDKHKEEDEENQALLREINNSGESPLDKINYFLTHKTSLDIIQYFCSGDSNLYFMNFYNNIISTLSIIQEKHKETKNKENFLNAYKILIKVYNSIKNADLLNNPIFLSKNWDLLDYFDIFSVGIPSHIIYNENIKNVISDKKEQIKKEPIIREFQLTHHTQYNYMRQEQAIIRKKICIDYLKTKDNDIINIYYNIKRFQNNNEDLIKTTNSRTKKKNISQDDNKYILDKTYLKILDKIDELLT
jgi:Holliday junction resolvasome RuvABC ATP-dependent DNA helicase subunit